AAPGATPRRGPAARRLLPPRGRSLRAPRTPAHTPPRPRGRTPAAARSARSPARGSHPWLACKGRERGSTLRCAIRVTRTAHRPISLPFRSQADAGWRPPDLEAAGPPSGARPRLQHALRPRREARPLVGRQGAGEGDEGPQRLAGRPGPPRRALRPRGGRDEGGRRGPA